jgi:phage shock protein A
MIMGMAVTVVVFMVLVLFVYLWNGKAFRRINEAGRAQVSKLGSAVWEADKCAIYQERIDAATAEVGEGAKGLEQCRGLIAGLQRQRDTGTKEVANLEALVKRYLSINQEDKAAEYAQKLNSEREHLETNSKQLNSFQKIYENNLKKIKVAQTKISEARQEARAKKMELDFSKAEAGIAELGQKFNINAANLDGLGEIKDKIQQEIDTNRSKAAVMADLSSNGVDDLEAEEDAKKEAAKATLEEFKAKMNLNSEVKI